MPVYSIVALIVLPLLGAVIAWAGDVIGYRLGKQRSSLWGLRPRTTARVVGAVVGAALPLVGLLVAVAISDLARTALLELDQLTSEQRTLRETNEMLQQANLKLRTKGAQLRDDAERVRQYSMTLEGRLSDLERERERLSRDVSTLTATRKQLQSKVTQLESQQAQARKQLAGAQQDLEASRQELDQTRQELAAVQTQMQGLTTRNQELEAKERQLLSRIGDLDDKVTELEGKNRDLQDASERLAKAVTEAEKQLADAHDRLDLAQRDVEATQRGLEAMRAMKELRQQEAEYWERQYQIYRQRHAGIAESPVVYEAGDLLLRVTVRTDQTDEQLATTLTELLPFAHRAAEARGARRGANGRAVLLVAPWPPDVVDHEATEHDIVKYLAVEMKKLSAVPDFVVSVVAFRRLVVAEEGQLHVAMWATPNVRVFAAGEVIAETSIAADSKPAEIFSALWVLLRRDVRQAAQQQGILAADPKTGQVGAVEAGDLFDAIARVEELGHDARVQVVAAHDTYTADELKIQFEIHRRTQVRSSDE